MEVNNILSVPDGVIELRRKVMRRKRICGERSCSQEENMPRT
jgi:hypothetical protein